MGRSQRSLRRDISIGGHRVVQVVGPVALPTAPSIGRSTWRCCSAVCGAVAAQQGVWARDAFGLAAGRAWPRRTNGRAAPTIS